MTSPNQNKKSNFNLRAGLKHPVHNSEITRITFTAFFLALALSLSFLEVANIYLPFGVQFSFRLVDTLMLFLAIPVVGIYYSLVIASLLPWLHVMIDGRHSPLSMFGFMLNDIVCVLFVYFLYYRFGKYYLSQPSKKAYYVNRINSVSQQSKLFWIKKLYLRFLSHSSTKHGYFAYKIATCGLLALLCAATEAASFIMVFTVVLSGSASYSPDDPTVAGGIQWYGETVFAVWAILFGVLLAKYIFEFCLFALIEKRFQIITQVIE